MTHIVNDFWIRLLALSLLSQAQAWSQCVVSNVRATQRLGTKLVDVRYDLTGVKGTALVEVAISDNGGSSYAVPAISLSGDIGEGVVNGPNKHFVWDAGTDWNDQFSQAVKFCITVNSAPMLVGIRLNWETSEFNDWEFISINPRSGLVTSLNSSVFSELGGNPIAASGAGFATNPDTGIAYAITSNGVLYAIRMSDGEVIRAQLLSMGVVGAIGVTKDGLLGLLWIMPSVPTGYPKSALCKVDPETGTVTVLRPSIIELSGSVGQYDLNSRLVVNRYTNIAYVYFSDKIRAYSCTTGALLSTFKLNSSQPVDVFMQAFSAFNEKLIGIRYNFTARENEFCSINSHTGAIQVLNGFHFPSDRWSPKLASDPSTGLAFAFDSSGELLTFDGNTGKAIKQVSAFQSARQHPNTLGIGPAINVPSP